MKKLKVYLSFLLFILLFISSFISSGMITAEELEWKVEVGDSTTFQLVQYYDKRDPDGDGDINTHTFLITDENGNQVNITWRVGSKVKDTLTQLNDSGAFFKRIYDGKINAREARTTLIVQKTVDNSTYWKEYAQSITTSTLNASVEGNIFTVEESQILPPLNDTLFQILKYDWKTGWLTYQYQKLFNASTVIGEAEFTTASSSVPGFEIPFILSCFLVFTIFLRKFGLKRQR